LKGLSANAITICVPELLIPPALYLIFSPLLTKSNQATLSDSAALLFGEILAMLPPLNGSLAAS
jgi:hypothetical protein